MNRMVEHISGVTREAITRFVRHVLANGGDPMPLETARKMHEDGLVDSLACSGCNEPVLDDKNLGFPHLHTFLIGCFENTCGMCRDQQFITSVPNASGSFIVARCDECVDLHGRENISDLDAALLAVRSRGGAYSIDVDIVDGLIEGDVWMHPRTERNPS